MRRSQVILRMPVDNVDATLILHDGNRSEAVLFIPPTEDIARLLGPSGARFLPMIREGKVQLVAREAIACLGVPAVIAIHCEGDLPVETQKAMVRLRSGVELVGELHWSAPAGQARTADFLNDDAPTIELHTPALTFHIPKAHIALVEER